MWCQRGIRARQFNATSSGSDGMRTNGGVGGVDVDCDGVVVDMVAVGAVGGVRGRWELEVGGTSECLCRFFFFKFVFFAFSYIYIGLLV